MHDQLNVIDDFNRESLDIEVDLSLPAERVIRTLDQIIEWRSKSRSTCCDNSPEYMSRKLRAWASKHDIKQGFIQFGSPQQNAYIKRYNRTVRYDWLAQYFFESIVAVQNYATQWLWHYNNQRHNMGLVGIIPKKLAIVA